MYFDSTIVARSDLSLAVKPLIYFFARASISWVGIVDELVNPGMMLLLVECCD